MWRRRCGWTKPLCYLCYSLSTTTKATTAFISYSPPQLHSASITGKAFSSSISAVFERTTHRRNIRRYQFHSLASSLASFENDTMKTETVKTPIKSRKRKSAAKRVALDSPVSVTTAAFTTTMNAVTMKSKEDNLERSDRFMYHDLKIPPSELRPSATLTTGQCFHWKVMEPERHNKEMGSDTAVPTSAWGTHNATEFVGVLRVSTNESIVVGLRETPDTTLHRVLHAPPHIHVPAILHDYFQLDYSLEELYQQWSKADPKRLARIATCIPGVRIVQQDPWECLISFICSSNNNIPRITKMLNAIRQTYGQPLITTSDENGDTDEGTSSYYSFPSLDTLLQHATEDDLRSKCGLGYRAKYIMETMKRLRDLGGESYLHELRSMGANDDTDSRLAVQEKLLVFTGVGRKVADCIALFSLRQANVIPVDVHVWKMARRDYDTVGVLQQVKSITPTIYEQVGDLFRSRFIQKAGWAHSLLFVAELPSFRPVLPADIVQDMDEFREMERAKKSASRSTKKI